jgi:hypothetical protein
VLLRSLRVLKARAKRLCVSRYPSFGFSLSYYYTTLFRRNKGVFVKIRIFPSEFEKTLDRAKNMYYNNKTKNENICKSIVHYLDVVKNRIKKVLKNLVDSIKSCNFVKVLILL